MHRDIHKNHEMVQDGSKIVKTTYPTLFIGDDPLQEGDLTDEKLKIVIQAMWRSFNA